VAEACGVTKQAVLGWKKTGRIDKKHLHALAQITKFPLTWWLDLEEEIEPAAATSIATQLSVRERPASYGPPAWPFESISARDYAQLSVAQQYMVEGFVKALLTEAQNKRKAAS
jgi:transcriptional regulator with XRE-family HTH domain